MNKTLFKKFISWFWGIIYLIPLFIIILESFRNGFDYSAPTSDIISYLESFSIPFFSDIVQAAINLFNATNNFGVYILLYMSSWFLFVTVVKFIVIMLYYFIMILEDIISKYCERVCK